MQLIKQSQIPISEIATIGKAFAESGMFQDTKQAAQAIVKIQAGQEMGIPPFAAMSGIHIIQGKPTVGSGLIASCIKKSGKYDYKIVTLNEKECSINFFEGEEKVGNCTFTIEDARKAGTKNLDKFPKNMLFARAISNGVKFYCPDVFSGPVYVPEEMNEVQPKTEDTTFEEVDTKPEEIKESVLKLANCDSVDDLKALKEILPDYVIKSEEFIRSANARYAAITKPVTQ
jgi:hypothetical protein